MMNNRYSIIMTISYTCGGGTANFFEMMMIMMIMMMIMMMMMIMIIVMI